MVIKFLLVGIGIEIFIFGILFGKFLVNIHLKNLGFEVLK